MTKEPFLKSLVNSMLNLAALLIWGQFCVDFMTVCWSESSLMVLSQSPFMSLLVSNKSVYWHPSSFNFFLAAVTLLFCNGISRDNGIQFNYRLNGSIFNPSLLRSQSNVTTSSVWTPVCGWCCFCQPLTKCYWHAAKPQYPWRYILPRRANC